jgi:ATP-dependent Clp protease ATP-binding subunit ClpC
MKISLDLDVSRIFSNAQKYAVLHDHASISEWHLFHGYIHDRVGSEHFLQQHNDIQHSLALKLTSEHLDIHPSTAGKPAAPSLSGPILKYWNGLQRFVSHQGRETVTLDDFVAMLAATDSTTKECFVSLPNSTAAFETFMKGKDCVEQPIQRVADTSPSPAIVDTFAIPETLQAFLEDFTAISSFFDPVVGRDSEIQQIIDVVLRRTKNNALLIGQPGVGKTAVVEGLAARMSSGNAPSAMANMKLIRLDLTKFIAGANYQGQLENRVQTLIDFLLQRHDQVILFIDEMHQLTMQSSLQNVATALKPALARGRIRLVGSTTYKEYRLHLAKDSALSRRFEQIHVAEPSSEKAFSMIKGVQFIYEEYHNVSISDSAIQQAIQLSKRYIHQRFLPDKAIDVLDHACAKAHQTGKANATVGIADINKAVHQLCGVPLDSLNASEKDKLLRIEDTLRESVVHQDDALRLIANAIRRNRTGMSNPKKPWGSFLLLGPTGVGKTELVRALSHYLFDSNDALIRIDMSEYKEAHSISRLIGSPPGYVGYEQGGILTDAVLQQPYSVVLLDETEKAHPEVLNLMLQVLDNGILTDGQGNEVDFRNTIVVFTSNLGARSQLQASSVSQGRSLALAEARQHLSPELFNRIDVVHVFDPLSQEHMPAICRKMLKHTVAKVQAKGYELRIDRDVEALLIARGFDRELGARPMLRAIQEHVEDNIATLLLEPSPSTKGFIRVEVRNGKTVATHIKRSEAKHWDAKLFIPMDNVSTSAPSMAL